MIKLDQRRKCGLRWKHAIVSNTLRYIQDVRKMTNEFIVRRLDDYKAEGYHAPMLLPSFRKSEDLISFTNSFRATYEMRVNPLMDRALWEHVDLPYTILPPLSRRPRDRPKKKRIRDSN
ncbi:hypothetical protein QJS10_CPB18g00942 [Acorus calamus]|uniref:Uncharacterized protein n=1 Tax=Acorus calamus TaxID=4465 RepID=A0AAV9CII4_ACOCL|nr:hypothetical protein QJS10_CPB18g00942 [Acorus calamus]